ncbi:MAG: phosphohydrolase, partial [Kiritimatiellae bacterium]|nr:phosphohydrolase [Kiritimatiellia bacterium]
MRFSKNELKDRIVKDSRELEHRCLDEEHAFFSDDVSAVRKNPERPSVGYFRTPFAHDVDRIIHSHSYARY